MTINIDIFAGGGGASEAMELAGHPPHVALNHDPEAIAVHAANHPDCEHICQDVFEAKPRDVTRGRSIFAGWFSPDCTHHSKAKGGKPRESKRRALAWVVVDYASLPNDEKPVLIFLENVEEFEDWGPLCKDGHPIKSRRGEEFHEWNRAIQLQGYETGWFNLKACDYGAPTTRNRLYYVARRDGRPINKPLPSHSRNGLLGTKRWRTAAEIIDFSQPCPSIFMTREEARIYHKVTGVRVNRPLATKTMARIAKGVQRFVIDAKEPFIIPVTHGRDVFRGHGVSEPLRTITCAPRGELALVAPTLIQSGYGERKGQSPRVPGLDKPLGTVVAGGCKHALVSAFLAQHNNNRGVDPNVGRKLDDPMPTVTTKAQQGIVTAHLMNMKGGDRSGGHHRDPATEPMFTATSGGNHIAEVRAFLMKYHWEGSQMQGLLDPLHTIDTKERFGLITVSGIDWQIVDIGMRMLSLRELARGQGLPEDYDLTPMFNGKPLSKTVGVRMVGNSVSPYPAEALIRAQLDNGPLEFRSAA